jgi:hypothetical protein
MLFVKIGKRFLSSVFDREAHHLTKELIESLASQLVDTPDPNRAQVIASRLQAAVRQHIDDLRTAPFVPSASSEA